MFPVRCVLVLGADDPTAQMQRTMETASKEVKNKIIEGALRGAAVQIGVQFGLMFAGPVGLAVGSLISLAQHFTGKYYTKKTKDVIEQASIDIKAYAKKKEKYVKGVLAQVAASEYPSAQALAVSNQDLGSWFTDLVDKGKKVVRKVVASPKKQVKLLSTVAAPVVSVPRIVLKQGLHYTQKALNVAVRDTGISAAVSKVGDVTGVNKAAETVAQKTGVSTLAHKSGVVGKGSWIDQPGHLSEKVDDVGTSAQIMASMLVPGMQFAAAGEAIRVGSKTGGTVAGKVLTGGAAEEAARISKGGQYAGETLTYAGTPTGLYNMMSGRESYLYALKAAAELKQKAFKMIDDMAKKTLGELTSPSGRELVRKQIAKSIRGDPEALEQARLSVDQEYAAKRALENQEAAERAALSELEKNAQPDTTSTGKGGLLVSIGAAAAAAFALTR